MIKGIIDIGWWGQGSVLLQSEGENVHIKELYSIPHTLKCATRTAADMLIKKTVQFVLFTVLPRVVQHFRKGDGNPIHSVWGTNTVQMCGSVTPPWSWGDSMYCCKCHLPCFYIYTVENIQLPHFESGLNIHLLFYFSIL